MDSCHIFQLIFGTRRATTELRKCFTRLDARSRDDKSQSDFDSQSSEDRVNEQRLNHQPISPFKQLHSKLVNFATSSYTTTTLQPDNQTSQASQTRQVLSNTDSRINDNQDKQLVTTISTRTHESGTYKATLVELPLLDEDENEVKKDQENHEGSDKSRPVNNTDENNNNQIGQQLNESYDQRTNITVYENPMKFEDDPEQNEQITVQRRPSETSGEKRVRNLVQSFESFDSTTAPPACDRRDSFETNRSNSPRFKWPPQARSNDNKPPVDELMNLEKDSDNQVSSPKTSKVKPTTIVKPMPPKTPPKTNRAKYLNLQLTLNKPSRTEQLFQDEHFLISHFFSKLQPLDRCSAAQVCRKWRKILYSRQEYWKDLIGVIDCNQLRREHLVECIVNTLQSAKLKHFNSVTNSNTINNPNNVPLACQGQPSLKRSAGSNAVMHEAEGLIEWLDQDEIWRIQDLCNRYTRGSLAIQHQFPSRTLISTSTINHHHHHQQQQQQPNQHQQEMSSENNLHQQQQQQQQQQTNNCMLSNSKSQCSIPSQISSTLSSISISSLLSPLSESSRVDSIREKLYTALDERGFDALCLFGATDDDIDELISKTRPHGAQSRVLTARLNNCSLSDKGLELFVSTFNQIEELELTGCNEISNGIELKSLVNLKRLIITDCINIADGLAQRLIEIVHQFEELVIQAYHLTDAFLEYISLNNDTSRLVRLELLNCKEITNSSMLTIAKHFQNLKALSISGSTKITDDGIEILTEHAKQLRCLDLSWCTKITDVALECIACDLSSTLNELILDRNMQITDVGLGYLATMCRLRLLYIRWCSRVTDLGLESILTMRSLRHLSLAGLHQITARSLLCLIETGLNQQLEEVELTNCPAVNSDLMQFLTSKMPNCNIIY